MKIDPTKAVVPNLLLLMNEVNPTKPMTDQLVTFGDPVAFTDPSGVSNSKITVTAIKNKGYRDSVTIAYRRLSFAQAFPAMADTWVVAEADTIAAVTARLVAAMGVLSSEFIINAGVPITLPTLTNQTVNVTIAAKNNSKLFLTTASKTVTLKMTLPIVEVTYSGIGNNLNTLTLLNSPTAIADYRLTITGVIGSTSTSSPALTIGVLPTGSVMTLINKGTIQGMGGQGGPYTGPGLPGGDAINALMNFSYDTGTGKTFGGGGGGGGCAQSWPGLAGLGSGYLRAAGGGGSGVSAGPIGTGTAVMTVGTVTSQPTVGTSTAGGNGAVCTNTGNTTQNSKGGNGGAPGAAGTAGVATFGTAGSTTITNFPGGAAGKAINLNGKTVTFIAGNNSTQIKGLVA